MLGKALVLLHPHDDGGPLGHHRELGDRTRALVEDVGEDRVTRLEAGHPAADLGHDTGRVAAERGLAVGRGAILESMQPQQAAKTASRRRSAG